MEYFPQNPAFVIVDTEVIVNASERYLVAGMGDAMATWYEARVCEDNPATSNLVGCRPTLAASALSEKCAHTLFEHGVCAAENVRNNKNVRSVARDWSTTIASFMKFGQPSVKSIESWPAYNGKEENCLIIDDDFKVSQHVDSSHQKLWASC